MKHLDAVKSGERRAKGEFDDPAEQVFYLRARAPCTAGREISSRL